MPWKPVAREPRPPPDQILTQNANSNQLVSFISAGADAWLRSVFGSIVFLKHPGRRTVSLKQPDQPSAGMVLQGRRHLHRVAVRAS